MGHFELVLSIWFRLQAEDSDDSLYQKQHLFLYEEVNRKEDEIEEQLSLKMVTQMTDDGTHGNETNVTPM